MKVFNKYNICRNAPSLILTNIQSLPPKHDDLCVFAALHKPDILAITESWLTEFIDDVMVNISSYSLHRQDRNDGRRGGGVCVCIYAMVYIMRSCQVGFHLPS